jgi:hypothetical protein
MCREAPAAVIELELLSTENNRGAV